jgi:hypothetical protein
VIARLGTAPRGWYEYVFGRLLAVATQVLLDCRDGRKQCKSYALPDSILRKFAGYLAMPDETSQRDGDMMLLRIMVTYIAWARGRRGANLSECIEMFPDSHRRWYDELKPKLHRQR